MKIMCKQEYYNQVVQYAESIKDTSLQNCMERLEAWEKNPDRPCEIELYHDWAPYSFGFTQRYPDGSRGIVGGLLYHGSPDESGHGESGKRAGDRAVDDHLLLQDYGAGRQSPALPI